MANDILIVPGSSKIEFSGSQANTIQLETQTSGSIAFTGASGSLFSIADSFSGSLMSVSDISGIPVLEVFDDDRVVMGSYSNPGLIVTGSKVGIGTASPSHKLHAYSADNAGFLLEKNLGNNADTLNEFSSYYALSVKSRNSGAYLNIGGNANRIDFQATDGAASATGKYIVFNPFGGNVGIGATAPAYKLQCNGRGMFFATNQDAGWGMLTLDYGNGTNTNIKAIQMKEGGSVKAAYGFGSNGDMILYPSNVERVRILSSGNVGIGNSSPANLLQVGSHVHVTSAGLIGIGLAAPEVDLHISNASPAIRFTDENVSNLKHQIIGGGDAGLEYSADINNVGAGYHRWDNGGAERMRLIENGNLGIGITNPTSKLHLVGGTNASRIGISDGTGGLTMGHWDGNYVRIESSGRKLGIFSYDGELSLGIDGTPNLTINTSGNVGIGVTDPDSELEIYHATDPQIKFSINTHGDAGILTGNADGLMIYGKGASNQIRFHANTTEYLRVDSGGAILRTNNTFLYGVTSGAATISLIGVRNDNWMILGHAGYGFVWANGAGSIDGAGNTYFTKYFSLTGGDGTLNGNGSNLGGSVDLVIGSQSSGKGSRIVLNSGHSTGEFVMQARQSTGYSNGNIGFYRRSASTTYSTLMHIGGDSKIGIGTESPDVKLHLFHSSAGSVDTYSGVNFTIEATSNSAMQFLTGANSDSRIWFGDASNNTAGGILYTHNATPASEHMELRVNSSTRLKILGSGYVGIGTTSPIRMLDIRDASGDPGIRLESAAQSADVITLRNADGRVGFGRDTITTTTTSMVGVANTSPLVPFNVGGNSAGINFDYMPSWNSYFIGANVKRSTTNGRMVRVASSTSRYPVAIAFGYQDVAGFGSEDSKGGINFITVGSNISGDIDPDTYSRMYIAGDGDIGIGDTTPSFKLDVNGTGRFTSHLRCDGEFKLGSSAVLKQNSSVVEVGNPDENSVTTKIHGFDGSGYLHVKEDLTEIDGDLRIMGTHKVGIGTTIGNPELDVYGSTTSRTGGVLKVTGADTTMGSYHSIFNIVSLDTTMYSSQYWIKFTSGTAYVGSVNSEVVYSTFTGAHISQQPSGSTYDDWLPGMIVKSTGVMAATGSLSLAWPVVTKTTAQKDKAVMGVYTDNSPAGHNTLGLDNNREMMQYNAVGEGKILVTDTNGNIETGDYICSSTRTGHGEKQDDDLMHNYTVAKATQPMDFSTITADSDLGYKSVLVACTYHCG